MVPKGFKTAQGMGGLHFLTSVPGRDTATSLQPIWLQNGHGTLFTAD